MIAKIWMNVSNTFTKTIHNTLSNVFHLLAIPMVSNNKTLNILRNGYKDEFAEFVFESDSFSELMMDLAFEFVKDKVDIVDEDSQLELATLLMDNLKLGNYL